MTQHERGSADFLRHEFQAAVRHFRLNPNVDNAGHLKSLDRYLDVAGSDNAFQDLRYWELDQSPDDMVLRRLYLALHLELLHAVLELLQGREPTDTVATRVERAVDEAMWPAPELAFAPGTADEDSVRSYLDWRREFASSSEALAAAGRRQFKIGDEFANSMVVRAQQSLTESVDPAVSYFGGTLDVLPRQPRQAIPPVEWLGDPSHQRGFVNAPSGMTLGEIARRWDGLWTITPFGDGSVGVAAKAASQADAQCYLASLFSRVAEITVNGDRRRLRIVASEQTLRGWHRARSSHADDPPSMEDAWSHQVDCWDAEHGLQSGDRVSIRVRSGAGGPLAHVLKGTIAKVAQHKVHLLGSAGYDAEAQDAEQKSDRTRDR